MNLQFIKPSVIKRDVLSIILAIFISLGFLFTTTAFIVTRDVTINDNGKEIKLHTFSWQVKDVLGEAGVTLYYADEIVPPLYENLSRVASITITRAYPVYIEFDGREIRFLCTGGNVGEALQAIGIELGDLDEVSFELVVETFPHMQVEVVRVFQEEVVEQITLPYREIRQRNTSMDKGFSRLLQEGSDGLKEETYLVTYKDGQEFSRELIGVNMLQPRYDRIIEEGANIYLASRGGRISFRRAIYVTATAYCPGTPCAGCPVDERGHSACTGKYNDGFTATGAKAVAGTGEKHNPHLIAVDPRVIPLGTKLYISGYGFAWAKDIGGAIKGNRIDILFATHEQALRFGRRRLKIYLLD